MVHKILWASTALAPVTILVDRLAHPGETTLFVLAAAALIPLAWLIGESTEHAAEHTGPGVGGFLNATFGNAPELIIALVAVNAGLFDVVRGSLAGSVFSNLLLVFGISQLVARDGAEMDRRSLWTQIGLCATAIALFLPAAIAGWSDASRSTAVAISAPVSILLLAIYVVVVGRNLRAHATAERAAPELGTWSLKASLAALLVATGLTALISEILVNSLESFADAIGATDFFIAAIIVAVVGNAAEHGGAVVIARAGKMRLASEIAISSSAQVALLVTPAIMLLSLAFATSMPLTFRWEEITAMAAAVGLTAFMIRDGLSHKWEGATLVTTFLAIAVWFWLA